jgi:hypothetical protein
MKSTFYQLFTAIFLFFSFSGISQTSVRGKVTDNRSDKPIIFASIAIYENDDIIMRTETDINGQYLFPKIDTGIYRIELSCIEYLSNRYDEVVIKSEDPTILDFTMERTKDLYEKYDVDEIIPTIEDWNGVGLAGISNSSILSEGRFHLKNEISSYSIDKFKYSKTELPSSGQLTAGEWNDLHNWEKWIALLEDEDYSIMTNRFEIYPTQRYSVLVINEDNNVIPNIIVTLKNENDNTIWTAITDNAGKAELWAEPFTSNEHSKEYRILANNEKVINPKTIDQGSNTIIIDQECKAPIKMDIVFTVDATSSMNDEIQFLKSELLDVIDRIQETNEEIEYRTGSVFYRDMEDDYITRISSLSRDSDDIIDFVKSQNANGGGDEPEAVDSALEQTLNLNWDEEALKIVFLILDAPPHEDEKTMIKIRSQIKTASAKGIKIIPITASGIGRETEFLMKFIAIMTNGTYVFITDDSGIGEAHLTPVVSDYEVEKLNDCIVRLITQYSKSYSCSDDPLSVDEIEVKVYPNPSTQYINIDTDVIADKISILSSNGMIIKTVVPSDKSTRIQLDELVNGVYSVAVYLENKTITKRVILLK